MHFPAIAPMPLLRCARALFCVAAVLVVSMGGRAEAAGLEEKSAPIIARAMAYDYNLKTRAGSTITVAVLYKSGDSSSEASADRWLEALRTLESVTIQGARLKVIKLSFSGGEKLTSDGQGREVDVLLVGDGLNGDISTISKVSRAQDWLTVGTRERHTRDGLAMAVFNEGGRNVISVNLPASNAEGVNFASDLLRLARVIR